LSIHCSLIYTKKQCLQALFVHFREAAGRKTCARMAAVQTLCKQ
jgi:hypothetical protein